MRRALALAALVVAIAAPAYAKEIVTFPLCDADGHCDRHCTVATPPDQVFRCGY